MAELTAEELKAKQEEEEKASLLAKEKATLAISKSQPGDPSTKSGELTDAQKLRIFEIQTRTVKDQGARLTAAEDELAKLRVEKEEAAKPTIDESAKAFYADPRKAIEEALEKAIAPLNKFKDRFESGTEYERIKKGLMVNPVYAQHLDNAQFAAIVDELIEEGARSGIQVSVGNVEAAIKHTIGSIVTGDIVLAPVKGSEVAVVQGARGAEGEPKREDMQIPPYLAPSSPPFKKAEDTKQYRELTENEARLARERGQTKEQYLDWLTVDPADVIDSKIGMKKEGDK